MDADGATANEESSLRNALLPIPRGGLIILSAFIALAYVTVAWWGWNGPNFFDDPARLALFIAFVALGALTPACGCNLNPGRTVRRSNEWIFLPLLCAGLLMGWAAARDDRMNVWTFGPPAIRYLGLAIFLLGSALRFASILTLGDRFSVWVAIQHGHRVQMSGLYRWMLHPSYTGAILTPFGWALVFRSVAGVLLVLTMIPPLISRMNAEEQLLAAEFGGEYLEYRDRTARLIPGVY